MTHGYWRLSRVHRETFPSPRIYFVSGWPKRNLNISEPSWLSLCSPLQRATDSISAPCRLADSQAAREANALITACHMIGLARVLSNKALMSSFNCLRSAPLAPPAKPCLNHTDTRTSTLAHTATGVGRAGGCVCPVWNGVQAIQNLCSSLENKQTIIAVIPIHWCKTWKWVWRWL